MTKAIKLITCTSIKSRMYYTMIKLQLLLLTDIDHRSNTILANRSKENRKEEILCSRYDCK